MNAKHAYLIIAHHQFELLELLCRCLDHPLHDIYIHLDAKVKSFDYDGLQGKMQYSDVHFLSERVNVSWGGYSQIQSELALFRAATPGEYEYYHIVSGIDLPLRTAQEIYDFFHERRGQEFIHYSSVAYCGSGGALDRVKYYHLLQEKVGHSSGVLKFLERCIVRLQKIAGIDRLANVEEVIKCGANWVSISHDLAMHILKREQWIKKVFRWSGCADEVFVQTIAWNSPFREKLYYANDTGDYHSCMRYVDWGRGKPYTFRSEDFDDLISSDFMFARKFDYCADPRLCEKLAQWVLDRSKNEETITHSCK